MANYAVISVLSQEPLWGSYYTGDMEAKVQEMIGHLAESLEEVLPDKPDLIVFPEACDRFPEFSMEERKQYYQYRGNRIRDYLSSVARENRCYIAYAACRYLPEGGEKPYRNSIQLLDRSGEVCAVYDKNHLVPAEYENGDIAYGTEAPVFQLDFGRVGCAICFDLNFDELMYQYAAQKPDLIIFSSFYHGSITQQNWAYNCRAYFAAAVSGKESRILDPFGGPIAVSTDSTKYATARINLDYALVHVDRNWPKYLAARKKYGRKLKVHDPNHIGAVMMTYEGDDRTVWDIIREFEILPLDGYFAECRSHKKAHEKISALPEEREAGR